MRRAVPRDWSVKRPDAGCDRYQRVYLRSGLWSQAAAILELVLSGGCELVLSDPILKELRRKLSTRFGWRDAEIDLALEIFRDSATIVSPCLVVADCVDASDNMFLEAAVEGRADCIVSGDRHLLRMGSFRGTEILTVAQFLERIGQAPER